MTAPALTIAGLTSGYGDAAVLNGLDLAVAGGQLFSLLGKNGMGKSTLLKAVMGFLPKMAGRVEFDSRDISATAPHLLARSGIAYVAQEQALFQDLTVRENIQLSVRTRPLDEALVDVGTTFPRLLERLDQRAGTLSGGEQKMLLLARSVATAPRLMLIDEISEGLQPSMVDRVASVLLDLNDRKGITTLLVEQNIQFATRVASSYAVLERGSIVLSGDTRDPGAVKEITRHLSV
jgi:branched-chain amino acid transport system ATP-binding protein